MFLFLLASYDKILTVIYMSFDGVFIHHLCQELKNILINTRINRVSCLDKSIFVLELANHNHLLISLSADRSHFRLIKSNYIPSGISFPFLLSLRKQLESSTIIDFYQIENDRIIVFTIEAHDYLGYKHQIHLIGEMFGRNANLILTDDKFSVIDCLKKTYVLTDNNKRIMVPNVKYQVPKITRINPYTANEIYDKNIYQGVSNLAYGEIAFRQDLSFLSEPTKPLLIHQANKTYFYCLDLTHITGDRQYFPSLSDLLEEYYLLIRKFNIQNTEQKILENHLKKETVKVHTKLKKQHEEYTTAKQNLNLKQIGNLLAANLHKIKRYDPAVTVWDFYQNIERNISLDPNLSPAQNMEAIFTKYKKAKRTIVHLEEQIKITEDEIRYLEILEEQINLSNAGDLKEIIDELQIIKAKPAARKKTKPHFLTYKDQEGNQIMVGKNNVQNNYLTHKVANKNDYFFHVKGAPGSHTVLRSAQPSPKAITLAATIAAYHSKKHLSANVAVDYTYVKYVKKIPHTKGSFVTYTNYKTVYVTPDFTFIKNNTI